MIPDYSSQHSSRFPTTHWSLVLAAGREHSRRSEQALAALCEGYWYPVYAYVRRQGYSADDALDLTQAFFARVLEKAYFQDADPKRGRFRSFLLVCLRHFLSNERDRECALKRGGQHRPLSLEVKTAEQRYDLEPRDDATPDKLFDRRWATTLLERVLIRLRDEHVANGRQETFEALKGFLTGDSAGVAYATVARTLSMNEGAVKVSVHRLRRRFRDLLIAEIAETVLDGQQVEDEIRHLLEAVSA